MPPPAIPVHEDDVADLALLIRSHHPIVMIDEHEEGRILALLEEVAKKLALPLLTWTAHEGLRRHGESQGVYQTEDPARCLSHLAAANLEMVVYLAGFARHLDDAVLTSRFKHVHDVLAGHRGVIVLGGEVGQLPSGLERLVTLMPLRTPTREALHGYVSQVIADLKTRMPVRVQLSGQDVSELLEHLKGVPFHDVRKIVTEAIVEDGILDPRDLGRVLESKRQVIQRTGVLEYLPVDARVARVAGLARLREWLDKRGGAFREPARYLAAGLTPPKGLLLTGIQGCGKSLCARVIANSWNLPLVRLDPGSLYTKYFGESERNLRRAMQTAESVAPVVLWIDEIEKAFGGDGDQDSGTSQRILGAFLTWLQEKEKSVFVLATANDVSRLPPELLRKGRFDEIFFVDLPVSTVREEILAVHLEKRGKNPAAFDLQVLAEAAAGFNGAELEQAIVSALYTSLARDEPLATKHVLDEIEATYPLSETMAERVAELRTWAHGRAVPAE